ncbi:MAG: ABC transporter ATP-binding protein [Deltaproteobacteria bacterium]|jgi:putative ABC transport system ATP-binding protein|nr:ABC transporter ATP-binding protein [Deltaproteobacteria bacterium]
MNQQVAVDVKNVTKTYGSGATAYTALKGVDFHAEPGEFVMLSGPSGSGKTTLLSILGCVLSPSSGYVGLLGEDISVAKEKDLPRLRLQYVGFVFQAHNLLASLTATENIAMLLRLRGWDQKDAVKEAHHLLDQVDLSDKYHSRPGELSGGQRQRVAIARALAGSPPVILADEPTAALDAHNGLRITEILRELAKEHGHTVVVVTHDNRIFHLGDRIVRIEDGLILKE